MATTWIVDTGDGYAVCADTEGSCVRVSQTMRSFDDAQAWRAKHAEKLAKRTADLRVKRGHELARRRMQKRAEAAIAAHSTTPDVNPFGDDDVNPFEGEDA